MNDFKQKLNGYSGTYLIEMASAFLNDTKLEAKREVPWDEVLYLARIHSLTGLLGYMSQLECSAFKPNEELRRQFLDLYFCSLQASIARDAAYQHIIDSLCGQRIPHLLMKGYVIQDYYPLRELRSMGDLDFVVHEEDLEKTDRLLKENGFTFQVKVGFVSEYVKGNIKAEAHTKLFSSTYTELNGSLVEYFSDCWAHAVRRDNGYSYEPDREYHLLYLLSHMAKHFRAGGCGVRMVLDIAVYLHYFEGRLDERYLWNELEKMQLSRFAQTIFGLCNRWFAVPLPGGVPALEDGTCRILSSFILGKGTFGGENANLFAGEFRREYEKNAGKNRLILRAGSLLRAAFPGADILKSYHPKAGDGFWFSLLAWFRRTYILLFRKKGYPQKLLRDMKNASGEAEASYALLRTIGL